MAHDIEEVRGTKVVIRFDGGKCIHSRHCVLDRPDVFVPNVDRRVDPSDRATPEGVAEIARNCPSGAITFERLDGGAAMKLRRWSTSSRVRENGPLAFHAEMRDRRARTCIVAPRCAAAAHRRTSRFATAATTRSSSRRPENLRRRLRNPLPCATVR